MSDRLPRHIAVIMDGNGRWAKQRGLPRVAGHRAGTESVRHAIEFCIEQKIEVLTLFALSVENRQTRPKAEVQLLMSLFLESLQSNTEALHGNRVRVRIVGDRSGFNATLIEQIEKTEAVTKNNTGLILVIAINYSGRWDIAQAAQQCITAGVSQVTESIFSSFLSLSDLPEPDLLIRTSGEQRISNFMLWQLAYSELYFTDVYWPDFDATVFQEAIDVYAARDRRFGSTGESKECFYA